ncbi:MAG TPA: DUF5009 domain-containing protein [Planctomycetota bacterium]|nr:DUF5009 domain-containing protein [Planctomycetota bacterium]
MTATPSPEVTRRLACASAAVPAPARLESLDAFRGIIMLLMASGGLNLAGVAKEFPNNWFLKIVGPQTGHSEWIGCTFWDLIQPSFMFMVGVALPWSLANRLARGQSKPSMMLHALWRALALILLSVFLQSYYSKPPHVEWTFPNVLAQIGLAYPFLFLISFTKPRVQWIIGFGILALYWLAFVLYTPPAGLSYADFKMEKDWDHLMGFAAHWDKHLNFAGAFDRVFLNLFPRMPNDPFLFNRGGYQTLNFIPSLSTMVFGLIAGELLRGSRALTDKITRLYIAGVSGLAIGYLLHWSGVCPMVKPIWTPSFAIFSAGWVLLFLAAFVTVMEWRGWKRWAFPLVVAGLNPITLYVMWQIVAGDFVRSSLKALFGPNVFRLREDIFHVDPAIFEKTFERLAHVIFMWLVLWWMYRRKIFIRI